MSIITPITFVAAIVVLAIAIAAVRKASTNGLVIDPISSAIVVAAGCALVIAGGYREHNDTSLFLTVVGCFVGAIGLVTWIGAGYRCRKASVGND